MPHLSPMIPSPSDPVATVIGMLTNPTTLDSTGLDAARELPEQLPESLIRCVEQRGPLRVALEYASALRREQLVFEAAELNCLVDFHELSDSFESQQDSDQKAHKAVPPFVWAVLSSRFEEIQFLLSAIDPGDYIQYSVDDAHAGAFQYGQLLAHLTARMPGLWAPLFDAIATATEHPFAEIVSEASASVGEIPHTGTLQTTKSLYGVDVIFRGFVSQYPIALHEGPTLGRAPPKEIDTDLAAIAALPESDTNQTIKYLSLYLRREIIAAYPDEYDAKLHAILSSPQFLRELGSITDPTEFCRRINRCIQHTLGSIDMQVIPWRALPRAGDEINKLRQREIELREVALTADASSDEFARDFTPVGINLQYASEWICAVFAQLDGGDTGSSLESEEANPYLAAQAELLVGMLRYVAREDTSLLSNTTELANLLVTHIRKQGPLWREASKLLKQLHSGSSADIINEQLENLRDGFDASDLCSFMRFCGALEILHALEVYDCLPTAQVTGLAHVTATAAAEVVQDLSVLLESAILNPLRYTEQIGVSTDQILSAIVDDFDGMRATGQAEPSPEELETSLRKALGIQALPHALRGQSAADFSALLAKILPQLSIEERIKLCSDLALHSDGELAGTPTQRAGQVLEVLDSLSPLDKETLRFRSKIGTAIGTAQISRWF